MQIDVFQPALAIAHFQIGKTYQFWKNFICTPTFFLCAKTGTFCNFMQLVITEGLLFAPDLIFIKLPYFDQKFKLPRNSQCYEAFKEIYRSFRLRWSYTNNESFVVTFCCWLMVFKTRNFLGKYYSSRRKLLLYANWIKCLEFWYLGRFYTLSHFQVYKLWLFQGANFFRAAFTHWKSE